MIDTLGLTAERCVELLDAREVSCRELTEAYLDRIERLDGGVHAFLRVRSAEALAEADRLDAEGRTGLQGVPIALKDILCTRGEETTAGSRILQGHRPLYDAGCVTRAKAAGLVPIGKTNMDEFAMGSSTEHSAFGVTHNPWDPSRVPGRLERRLGGGRRRGIRAALAGHGHRRVDPPAGRPVRHRRAEADVRRGVAARADRVRLVARPGRAVRAHRARRGVGLPGDRRPRPAATRRRCRCPSRCGSRMPSASRAFASACPYHLLEQGIEPGVRASFDAALEQAASLGAEILPGRAAARAVRAAGLLPDRAGRGVGQPGPLRRRPLRPAARGAGRHDRRDVRADAGARASAPRSSGGSCSAPTRCRPATTTPTTARRCAPGR